MNRFLDFRSLHDLSALTSQELSSLRETARTLRLAASSGRPQKPLRGKNIALLSETDSESARALELAAAEAGAQVARIRPSDAGLADAAAATETARLLGRLYDAVACEGLPRALVQTLQQETGVPVYEDLGSFEALSGTAAGGDAAAAAGDAMTTVVAPERAVSNTDRTFLLQAMLLCTIG